MGPNFGSNILFATENKPIFKLMNCICFLFHATEQLVILILAGPGSNLEEIFPEEESALLLSEMVEK